MYERVERGGGGGGGGGVLQKDLVTLSNMKIGIMISNSIESMNNLIII